MKKPNILFVFSDQQNRYALGCMDNPNVMTPNLDRLAERGVLFRRCYSNDPVCGPFRGSLLTGQYTSRCGVHGNGCPLPEGTTTFADAFNAAGYQLIRNRFSGGAAPARLPVRDRLSASVLAQAGTQTGWNQSEVALSW